MPATNGHGGALKDPGWVRANADALLEALESAEQAYDNTWTPIELNRLQVTREDGSIGPFSFRVRGLHHSEVRRCRRQAAMVSKVPGTNDPEPLEVQKEAVYTATHPDDRASYWDNPAFRERYKTVRGQDVVAGVLFKPGELARAFAEVLALCDASPEDLEVAKSTD